MAKNNLVTPRTLAGFMELLPREQLAFERMRRALEDVYRLYGFYPLDTPVLEYSEILFAKAGGETEKQVYRFTKGDTDLAMRFDLCYTKCNRTDLVSCGGICPTRRKVIFRRI